MVVKSKKWIILGVVGLMVGAVVVKKSMSKNEMATVVETNTTAQYITQVHGVGTLEAKEIVVLAPKTTSKIASLFADEGDSVKANQVLAKMEISELQGNMMESDAAIEKSRSQITVQKAIIEELEAKKVLADTTMERYQTLLKGGFVTQAEFDTALASQRSTAAAIKAARENLISLSHDINKSKATLVALRAKTEDLTLCSPFDGIVLSRNAETGSTVNAGAPVFRLANPKTLWVKIYIDERQSGLVRIGQKATVILRSQASKSLDGEVVRIGMESDRITEERVVYIRLRDGFHPFYLGEQAEADIHL